MNGGREIHVKIGQLAMENDFYSKCRAPMSERRELLQANMRCRRHDVRVGRGSAVNYRGTDATAISC